MGVVVRNADQPGDLGWMVWQHGEVYAAPPLGWDATFEALVARIVADFAEAPPDPRLGAWIAELDGRRVGCVLCVPGPTAYAAVLRILLVTPEARGHGAGSLLVATVLDHARAAGCTSVTLWTNDVLASARRIYEAAGFELVGAEAHHSFGQDLVGQHWRLALTP